jgi:hypothetical protein
MRNPHVIQSGLAAILTVGLAGLVGACSNPLSGLDGTIGEGSSAGVSQVPGRVADYTGWLANHTGQVVILKSAQLLPLKGFHTPRLVHYAAYTGLIALSSWRNWPPAGAKISLQKFSGYRVRPGRRIMILYGVVAYKLGEYADAGLKVSVLVNGNLGTVDVISPAGTCVVKNPDLNCPNSFYNHVQDVPNP